jgi:hypothetical protein
MEMLRMGVPIVSISPNMFYYEQPYWGDTFEVSHILEKYDCGKVGHTIEQCVSIIQTILADKNIRVRLSNAAKIAGKELFSEDVVKEQWEKCLSTIQPNV